MNWYVRAQADEYMTAVSNGDIDTARQMAMKRARTAGYVIPAFHCTENSDFTVFKTDKLSAHFGTEETARERGKNLHDFSQQIGRKIKPLRHMQVLLRIQSPLRMEDMASIDDMTGSPINDIIENMTHEEREAWEETGELNGEDVRARAWEGDEDVQVTLLEMGLINIDQFEDMRDYNKEALVKYLKREGYDGIVYTNAVEGKGTDSYIIFDPEQVKLAAPVTKDDKGRVIPLQARFDPTNPDVRY